MKEVIYYTILFFYVVFCSYSSIIDIKKNVSYYWANWFFFTIFIIIFLFNFSINNLLYFIYSLSISFSLNYLLWNKNFMGGGDVMFGLWFFSFLFLIFDFEYFYLQFICYYVIVMILSFIISSFFKNKALIPPICFSTLLISSSFLFY